jgi:hypothetical protein
MNFNLSKIAIALALMSPMAYAAQPAAISQTKDGVTVTAQAMTAGQSLDAFGKDLSRRRVIPVSVSIQNNGHKALTFSSDALKIEHAKVLTHQGLESSLETTKKMTGVALMVFFPLAFIAGFPLIEEYEELLPIVKANSFGEHPIVIQPGATFKTIAFIQCDLEKDANNNILPFVAPKHLDMTLSLKNTEPVTLQIPTTAVQ